MQSINIKKTFDIHLCLMYVSLRRSILINTNVGGYRGLSVTHMVRLIRFFSAMLLQDVMHVVVLLCILLFVQVDVAFGRLPFDGGVVGKLAFLAFLAKALLEKGTKYGLWVGS